MKLPGNQKAIHIIRCIAVLLIIAFWIFLFAWADEKYLLSYNPDYKTEREIILLPEYTFSPAIERILTKMELQAVGIALCIIIFYFYFKSLAANIAIFVIGMMIFVLLSLRICPKCGKRLQTYEEKEKDGNGEWRILCCHKCKIKSKVHYVPDSGVES